MKFETTDFGTSGLNDEQVLESRKRHGTAGFKYSAPSAFVQAIKGLLREPMVVLLFITGAIYFILGQTSDGYFLIFAILAISTISLFQNHRSQKALEKLKQFNQPPCKVIRNKALVSLPSIDIVVGDFLVVQEGGTIAADGCIIKSNDFSVNESAMTGESLPVFKNYEAGNNQVFMGTNVTSGLAVIKVGAIGDGTALGEIRKHLQEIKEEKSPLEQQLNRFVRKMIIAGAAVFLMVFMFNFYRSADLLASMLQSMTLAMSILPEEIPVAFATFMALGAWTLMQKGILVKQMRTVETLGSASVICSDKTGTLTENKMEIISLFICKDQAFVNKGNFEDGKWLIRMGMWASEPIPFDPMDLAFHHEYSNQELLDERKSYLLCHEYALQGVPPMMTHIFENKQGERIIASKGAPEAYLDRSGVKIKNVEATRKALAQLGAKGYRVLGIGQSNFEGDVFPQDQQSLPMELCGLVAFYDPPKKNISEVINGFYQAGIKVKIVTGDNALTTAAIAQEIGLQGGLNTVDGAALVKLSATELNQKAASNTLFTRMFPQAKLLLINALKQCGETVAMVGDGVNDGPALRTAHIGIAMGKKGTEVAKEAAALILTGDDLAGMLDGIAIGRKIYDNLKRAIRYIISIHIPIISTVALPLMLGWKYTNIFSPVHIIFFELIMGPTCSIIYEREPIEKNTMTRPPRLFSSDLFSSRELLVSVVQGMAISLGILMLYAYSVSKGYNESMTRTMVFSTLVISNMILTLVNRSFFYSIFTTIKYKNKLLPLTLAITTALWIGTVYIKPIAGFFGLSALNINMLILCLGVALISVIWMELVKWKIRKSYQMHQIPN